LRPEQKKLKIIILQNNLSLNYLPTGYEVNLGEDEIEQSKDLPKYHLNSPDNDIEQKITP
jgi:hypothetical protein